MADQPRMTRNAGHTARAPHLFGHGHSRSPDAHADRPHWRWLILGAVALGFAGAILMTLLTPPVYRASVTLEANPPTFLSRRLRTIRISRQFGRRRSCVSRYPSRTSAEPECRREARRRNSTSRTMPRSSRRTSMLEAPAKPRPRSSAGGLKVIPPQDGELIKFILQLDLAAACRPGRQAVADSFINTAMQRRYEASAYARNFLERQINKPAETSKIPSGRWSPMRSSKASSTRGADPTASSRRGHQLASGQLAGEAQPGACRRDRAAGRRRRRISPGIAQPGRPRSHQSTIALQQQLRRSKPIISRSARS